MKASAEIHRGENGQSHPVGTSQRLLLNVAHILQRAERTCNHMAETHAQSEENRRGWGVADRGGERYAQSERRYKSESVHKIGHFKGVGEDK